MVRSLAGDLGEGKLSRRRTFRDPHHSATLQATGRRRRCVAAGRGLARPSRRAVPRRTAGVQPRRRSRRCASRWRSGRVTVARANAHVTYPARFQLVAAMNPCRCGHLMEPSRACGPRPRCGARLPGQALGPAARPHRPLHRRAAGRCRRSRPAAASRDVRRCRRPGCGGPHRPARATGSVRPQGQAFGRRGRSDGGPAGRSRAQLVQADAATPTPTAPCWRPSPSPTPRAARCLTRAAERLGLSARAWHRPLRVARTLADLDGSDAVRRLHIARGLELSPTAATLGAGRVGEDLAVPAGRR